MGKFLLNSLACIMALLAIYFLATSNIDYYMVFKPLTTSIVLLLPLLYGKRNTGYLYIVITALLFCLAGDILLLNEAYFVFGLISFLVAHILFFCGFITIGGLKKYWIPLIILLIIGCAYYSFIYKGLGKLYIAVAIYILILLLMAWQGISLYLWQRKKEFFAIAIAVVLFLVSDAVLAFDKFKEPFEISGILILSTYWASISLLANSTLNVIKI